MKIKLIFLDRDGVINEYPGDFKYVTGLRQFRILPNVKPALEKLVSAGFRLYVVSNQAGVSKGLYTVDNLQEMDRQMISLLGEKVRFSGIFYCTHRPEENCSCRKPKTGFIDKVFAEIKRSGDEIDRANSYFVGDSLIDIETGQAAGLKTILVFSGKEKPQNQLKWGLIPDYKADDLASAAQIIISS